MELKNMNTAIVLAGGQSTRMPFDKQTISIGGKLIAHYIADQLSLEFDQVFIISNTPHLYKHTPYKVLPDQLIRGGPMGGIYTGLHVAKSNFVYFTGCDMPFVNLPYIRFLKKQLLQAQEKQNSLIASITAISEGILQPLNCFYAQDIMPYILTQWQREHMEISKLCSYLPSIYIPESVLEEFDPEHLMFVNLNTLDDVNKYIFYGDYDEWIRTS